MTVTVHKSSLILFVHSSIMSDNNSPKPNDTSSLRNLPQSFHFNPRMRSPGNNLSPYTPRKTNADSSDFISFSSSSPADNRNHSFRHFNKTPYMNRGKFRSNRSRNSFSSPNTSFNSSRNSSFSSMNSSFNSSQNYTPSSQVRVTSETKSPGIPS